MGMWWLEGYGMSVRESKRVCEGEECRVRECEGWERGEVKDSGSLLLSWFCSMCSKVWRM